VKGGRNLENNKPESNEVNLSHAALLARAKSEYIKMRYGEFEKGNHNITLKCEFCGKEFSIEITVSRSGKIYLPSYIDGAFHEWERDYRPESLQFLCSNCHRRIHEWGLIQRWLVKIGKKVSDLPDARKLKSIRWVR
jgi:hypothetical protein